MATIGSLVVELKAETAALRRDLEAARGHLAKTEQAMESLARGAKSLVGAFVSFQTVRMVLGQYVSAVTEAEKSQAKLDAVLQATGHSAGLTALQINKLADEMQRRTLFDDDQVRDAAGVLATFREVQGQTFTEAIRLAADMSAIFGQDLKGSVVQLGKALNNPIEGFTALKRVGVSFTDAQRDLIQSMVETGNVAGAQRVILDELRVEFGGAAEGQHTGLTGALHDASKAWDDFLEAVGKTESKQGIVERFFRGLARTLGSATPETDPREIHRNRLDEAQREMQQIQRFLDDIERRTGTKLGPDNLQVQRQKELQSVVLREAAAIEAIDNRRTHEEQAAAAAGEAARKQAEEDRRRAAAADEATAALKRQQQAAARLRETLQTPIERANAHLDEATQLLQAGLITQEEWNRALVRWREESHNALAEMLDGLPKVRTEMASWGPTLGDLANHILQVAQNFEKVQAEAGAKGEGPNALAKAGVRAADAWDTAWHRAIENTQDALAGLFSFTENQASSLQAFLLSVLQTVNRIAAQMAAAKIIGAFTSFVGGGVGGAKSAMTDAKAGGLATPKGAPVIAGTAPGPSASVVHIQMSPRIQVTSLDPRGASAVIQAEGPTLLRMMKRAVREDPELLALLQGRG